MGRRAIISFEEVLNIPGLEITITVGAHQEEDKQYVYRDCQVQDGEEFYTFDYHQGTLECDFNRWGQNFERIGNWFDKHGIAYRVC